MQNVDPTCPHTSTWMQFILNMVVKEKEYLKQPAASSLELKAAFPEHRRSPHCQSPPHPPLFLATNNFILH